MANMYPKNINEYMPTDSERIVYQELKNQLPDSFDVFYSVARDYFDDHKGPIRPKVEIMVEARKKYNPSYYSSLKWVWDKMADKNPKNNGSDAK